MHPMLKLMPFLCKIGFECGKLGAPTDTCMTDADCTGGLKCVIESPSYSQCTDCTPAAFATQCESMSETFLLAAEAKCGISTCKDRCPHHTDADCDKPDSCVVQQDGYYAKCVDCTNSTSFNEQCIYWSEQMRTAAEAKCKLNCTKLPPPSPPGPSPGGHNCAELQCTAPAQCVEQSDHNWAQCVDCTNATTYAQQCKGWSPSIRTAAAAKCGLPCTADSGGACHAPDLPCPKPQSCVTQADGYFSQCIDCTSEQWFDNNCKYWSDQIRNAAEKACNLECPK